MERDLALIRSKRAERDRAVGVLKTQSVNEALIERENEKSAFDENINSKQISKTSGEKEANDTIMTDSIVKTEAPNPFTVDRTKNPSLHDKRNANKTMPVSTLEAPQYVSDFKGLAVTTDASTNHKLSSPKSESRQQDSTSNSQDQLLETPTTTNLRENDFETMFNDIEPADGDDGKEFDAVSPTDNHHKDTGFEQNHKSNEDLHNINATSNEDINTLLPGLENFVNEGDEFSMVGVPAVSTLPTTSLSLNEMTTVSTDSLRFETAPTESNFEDLFSSGNFVDGTEDYELNGNSNVEDTADFDDWLREHIT